MSNIHLLINKTQNERAGQSLSQQHKKITPKSVKSINLNFVKELKLKDDPNKPVKSQQIYSYIKSDSNQGNLHPNKPIKIGLTKSSVTSPEIQLFDNTLQASSQSAYPLEIYNNSSVIAAKGQSKDKITSLDSLSTFKNKSHTVISAQTNTLHSSNSKILNTFVKKDFNADLSESKLPTKKENCITNLSLSKKIISPKTLILEQPSMSGSSLKNVLNTTSKPKEMENKVKSSINMNSNINISEASVYSTINDSNKKSPNLTETQIFKKVANKCQSQNDNIHNNLSHQTALNHSKLSANNQLINKPNSATKDMSIQILSNSNTPYSMNGDQSRVPSNPRNTSAFESFSIDTNSCIISDKKAQICKPQTADKSLKHLVKQVNFNLDLVKNQTKMLNKTRNSNNLNVGNDISGLSLSKSNTQGLLTVKQPFIKKGSVVNLISDEKTNKAKAELKCSDSQKADLRQKSQPINIIQNIQHNTLINININDAKKGLNHIQHTTTQGFLNKLNQGTASKVNLFHNKENENVKPEVKSSNEQTPIVGTLMETKSSIGPKKNGTEESSIPSKKKNESKLQSILDRINKVEKKHDLINNNDASKKTNNNSISETILNSFVSSLEISKDNKSKFVQPVIKKSETDSLLSVESIFDGNFCYLFFR